MTQRLRSLRIAGGILLGLIGLVGVIGGGLLIRSPGEVGSGWRASRFPRASGSSTRRAAGIVTISRRRSSACPS